MTPTTTPSPATMPASSLTPAHPPDERAAAPAATLPSGRFAIRQKGISRGLKAYKSDKSERLTAKDGRQLTVLAGDMVLLQDGFVFDAMPLHDFERMWEVLPEGGLILHPIDQAAIEHALGFGSTRDSQSLRLAVEKMARLTVGDIVLTFTPAQWDDLQNRATKRGVKLDVYMKGVLDRWMQDLWTMSV